LQIAHRSKIRTERFNGILLTVYDQYFVPSGAKLLPECLFSGVDPIHSRYRIRSAAALTGFPHFAGSSAPYPIQYSTSRDQVREQDL
jgi:hypothetical protein